MATLQSISRLHKLAVKELFFIDGTLDYDRITDLFITLANAIDSYDGESEDIWCLSDVFMEPNGKANIAADYPIEDIITGSYWHFTEWHSGQWSKGYSALSALGMVYTPNYESVDVDNDAYQELEAIAA